MNGKLSGGARWCAISALWVLQTLASALAWVFGSSEGVVLSVGQWAKDMRAKIKGGVKK